MEAVRFRRGRMDSCAAKASARAMPCENSPAFDRPEFRADEIDTSRVTRIASLMVAVLQKDHVLNHEPEREILGRTNAVRLPKIAKSGGSGGRSCHGLTDPV